MKKTYLNKMLIFLLLLCLILPLGLPEIKVKASQTGMVTANSLNVRSKPSTTSDKVQLSGADVYLTKGETVTILKKDGDWYYVSLEFNDKTVKGYVHSDFVKVKETPKPTVAPAPTPKPTPKPKVTPTPDTADMEKIAKNVTIKGKVKANSLNVRSGPGTTYPKAGGLMKGQSVTVINEALSDSEKWYAVTFSDGKQTVTGYVLSRYIEPDYEKSIKGEIGVSKAKIRSAAGSKASYLKNKAGNIISLKKGKNVSIVGEKIVENEKWYKFTFTSEDKKKTGYAPASQIVFRKTVKEPTKAPEPTATPKPTKKPKASVTPTPIPKPTKTPTPTLKPTKTPTPMPKPTKVPTPAPEPTKAPAPTEAPADDILTVANVEIHRNITSPLNGYVCNTIYLNVMDNILASQNMLLDSKNEIVVINNGQKVTVTGDVSVDNVVWYKITFSYNYQILSGFVRAEYIYIGEERPISDGSITIPDGTVTPAPTPITGDPTNLDFEAQLALENFPESYKASLRQLHAQYPNWIFKAYHTGLYWDTVIAEENVPARNLIPNNKSVEWKSLMEGAYNWKNDTFIVFDGSTWVTASKEAIEYYMDPRNFLTTECIFQFELLKYQENYQNITGIENILKGTAMSNAYYSFLDESGMQRNYSYGETFLEAAKYSGVSPYHLASRVKQEVVTGSNTLSGSVSGTYSGYEGYYNFYNIGANDSAGGGAIKNGLKFAKNGSTSAATNALYMIPWTNPYRAIVGGSYFLGNGYINRGQDTIYLQKFNVTPKSTYVHQYMSNVEAPWAEGRKVRAAYLNMTDTPIVFSIPVYLNMPSQSAPRPTTKFNPNNRLKSLKVLDMNAEELTITPTFSQTEYNYFLIVPEEVTTIEIKAATVSKKATLGGGGLVQLADGNNEIVIPVIAENGDVAEYTINIVRE